MDRLWRSNSSISSKTSCPPDIVNEEDHNVDDNEIPDFTNWTIPKVDTKNIYKRVALTIEVNATLFWSSHWEPFGLSIVLYRSFSL